MANPRPLVISLLGAVLLVAAAALYAFTVTRTGDQTPSMHFDPPPTGYGEFPSTPASPTQFVNVAERAGLQYRWALPGNEPRNILQTIGNGCAFLDYDNDGNLDILLVGPRLGLYRGDGHGNFTDVTHETGLDTVRGCFLGCSVGDYDNDGYDDIFLTGYHTAALLHNESGKRFTDVTAGSGIDTTTWSTSATWAEVMHHGRLDLYVCNYVEFGPDEQQLCTKIPGFVTACSPTIYRAEVGLLYRNDGSGHFTDVTKQLGADTASGKGLGAAFADFDGSGRQSLFVANDQMPADLFVNSGSQYSDISYPSGSAVSESGKPYSGMGVDWGDYDNDGKLDLAVMDFGDEDKMVFHNDGHHLFSNRSIALGMRPSTYTLVSFGVKWIDYDNDGWLDLVMSSGGVADNIEKIDKYDRFKQPIMLFHNVGGRHFDNVTAGLTGPGVGPIVGRGLAIGDYDNDGRMDVLVVDSSGAPILLHNETPDTGNWLEVILLGRKSNRDGYGAVVTAVVGSRRLVRLCHADGSYMSSSDKRVHIGLGKATTISTLTVQWPSGHIDRLKNIAANQIVTVTEGNPGV